MVLVLMIFRQWQHPQKLMWVGVVFCFFRLNLVPFVHPFWNSELFWQLRTVSDHKTKWKLHVAWKIYRTIGWLWHPEKGGQQILACKLRLIVTILPYGFIQSTAIAKKNHPKNIGHVQSELTVSLEKHVLFHFGMISGSQLYILRLVPFYQSTGYPRKCIWSLLSQS